MDMTLPLIVAIFVVMFVGAWVALGRGFRSGKNRRLIEGGWGKSGERVAGSFSRGR